MYARMLTYFKASRDQINRIRKCHDILSNQHQLQKDCGYNSKAKKAKTYRWVEDYSRLLAVFLEPQ